MQFQLPAALETFREKFLSTRQSFVRITSQDARKTQPWESKIGGAPYRPKNMEWPKSPEGRELVFLAQINFAEMPAFPPFPDKGLLQFFIHDDDLYGMDFDESEKQDTFRVVYHAEVSQDVSLLQKAVPDADWDETLLPHHPDESYPLRFVMDEEVAPISDYRFYQHFGGDFFRQFEEKEWEVMGELEKSLRSQGHKIGGYAYFTQDDPRRPEDPMLLLLQLDSDERADLMWGDMGVGHFFIRESDLLKKDFSRVLYDWDCL